MADNGDDFHLTTKDIVNFTFPFNELTEEEQLSLKELYETFVSNIPSTIQFKLNAGINVGTFNTSKLWYITDKSDRIFLKHLTSNVEEVWEKIMNHLALSVITNKGE